jgi:hypothetical protein
MKTLTPDDVALATERIITEQEKLSAQKGEPFSGVPANKLIAELGNRIGPEYSAINVHFKLTREDINALANSRFYKRTGQKILMGAGIIILVLLLLTNQLRIIPPVGYYIAVAVVALGFVTLYGKKQREYKRELAKGIPGGNLDLGE